MTLDLNKTEILVNSMNWTHHFIFQPAYQLDGTFMTVTESYIINLQFAYTPHMWQCPVGSHVVSSQ